MYARASMPHLYLKEISFGRRKILGIWRTDVNNSASIAHVLDGREKNVCLKPEMIHFADGFGLHGD